jgi:hypothetical protein
MITAGASRGGGSTTRRTSAEAALVELLESQGLSIYHGALISDGYETVDDVRMLSEQELIDDINMKKGHARRLMKALSS